MAQDQIEVKKLAVRRAIFASGGERTTQGVPSRFTCGACGLVLPRDAHAGGVWAKLPDGTRFHASICEGCSTRFAKK